MQQYAKLKYLRLTGIQFDINKIKYGGHLGTQNDWARRNIMLHQITTSLLKVEKNIGMYCCYGK
jgi:hypothetical protein